MNDIQNLEISWVQNEKKIMIINVNLTKKRGWEIVIRDNKIILINGPLAIPMELNDYVDNTYKQSINYNKEYTQIEFKTRTLWNKLFSKDKDIQNKTEINKVNNILY